jgi:hypothetical protein
LRAIQARSQNRQATNPKAKVPAFFLQAGNGSLTLLRGKMLQEAALAGNGSPPKATLSL